MRSDSSAFLTALRLSDSFLPVGAYTASYGIEQYVNEGLIDDASDLQAVTGAYLERVVGPCETVAVANAHAASDAQNFEGLLAVDDRLHAVTMPREFRESSTKAGAQLCDLLLSTEVASDSSVGGGTDGRGGSGGERSGDNSANSDGDRPAHAREYAACVESGETPGHYAVVFGVYAQTAGLEREDACLAQGYAFLVGLLGAAQRLGRFGHTEIQAILGALLPELETICARHVDEPLERMGAFAPFAEVMGMRHEQATRRLFMS